MIPGTGLGNLVTMLPKYHKVTVPLLGREDLEFVFSLFLHLFWGLCWLLQVLWQLLSRAVGVEDKTS